MTKKHVSLLVVFVLLFTTLFSSFAFAADGKWVVADEITIKVNYHVQSYGNKTTEGDGAVTFGTSGEAKRLENFVLTLVGAPKDMEIRYGVHAQSFGDIPATGLAISPEVAGTAGKAKRVEGVKIALYKKGTNELYPGYQVSYQVHMQGYGWGADAKNNWKNGNEDAYVTNGIFAGTRGESRRVEAVALVIERLAELKVDSVSATNLIQADVNFNQKVDKETAENKDNYSFATADKITIASASLSDDGSSVTLTFAAKVDQQKKATLTVNGVKSVAGDKMTKSSHEVSFLDNTIPTILDAQVVGVSTVKVIFSEPMNGLTVQPSSFKVNEGKYFVKSVAAQKNNTEFLVELYTSLKTGEFPFEVKVGPADYAGFTAMGGTFTLAVTEDKEAPVVVSYRNATPNSVVLVWSEDIVLVNGAKANYYHTNASNQIANNLTAAEIDGNEMTLTFATASKLPNGTAYVYVLKDSVKDLWNNKNTQQMTKVDVEVDNQAPVLQTINVKAENKIELVFDEAVAKANVKANYTLLDKDGKEVTNIFSSFDVSTAKKVTVTFTKKLDGGDYTLVVKNIEDVAGNAMASTAMAFTVTDKTAPSGFTAKLYRVDGSAGKFDQLLKVSFGEAMAIDGAYSVDDLSKYVLASVGAIEDLDDVTITVVDDGKAVEIVIPNTSAIVPTGAGALTIARVADASGNYTTSLTNLVEIVAAGDVTIEKVELTGPKVVKVYFSSELAKFEANEVKFTTGGAISTVTTDIVKGKTVATYTLSDALKYDASNLQVKTTSTAALNVTANRYGETLVKGYTVGTVVDKLAPAIAALGDDDNVITVDSGSTPNGVVDQIKITYEENLFDNFTKYSFAVEGRTVTDVTCADNVVTISLKETDSDSVLLAKETDVTPVVTQLLDIYDVAGNKLAASSDAIVPLDKVKPLAIKAEENADAKVVTLTFTEELDSATVVQANFTGTAGTPTVSYVAGSKTVTLTYSTALDNGKTIVVGTAVKDANGNAIAATTFTRGSEAAGAGVYTK